MAQIDSSIALNVKPPQFESPVNAMARVLQMQGLQQDQQMGRLQMDEYQRGIGEKNRLQQILGQGGDSSALRKAGFLKESMEMDKNSAEVTHKQSETTKNSAEVASKKIGLYRDAVNGVNDPASAVAYIQAMHADPDLKGSAITAVPIEQLIAQVPQDPAQFMEFKRKFSLGADKYMTDERARQQMVETNRHNTTSETNTVRGQDLTASTSRRGQDISASTARRGQDLVDGRSREANEQGKVPAGYRRNAAGNLEFIPGGPADPNAAGGAKMTEDQGKATGWLIQAENAFANMKGALDPKAMFSPATPGLGDAVAAVPGLGGLGNSLRSENRQKFVQGASSLSEALLRAATGAGVNKDEAKQKIQELTPQWGDGPEVIKQKTDAIPLYIESLKVRAGPGAKKAAGVMANSGVPSDIAAILNKHGGK